VRSTEAEGPHRYGAAVTLSPLGKLAQALLASMFSQSAPAVAGGRLLKGRIPVQSFLRTAP